MSSRTGKRKIVYKGKEIDRNESIFEKNMMAKSNLKERKEKEKEKEKEKVKDVERKDSCMGVENGDEKSNENENEEEKKSVQEVVIGSKENKKQIMTKYKSCSIGNKLLKRLCREDIRDKVFMAILAALDLNGNRPSSPKELANTIIANKLTLLGGATPFATVSSRISQHFKRSGDESKILGRYYKDGNPRKILYYIIMDEGAENRQEKKRKLDFIQSEESENEESIDRTPRRTSNIPSGGKIRGGNFVYSMDVVNTIDTIDTIDTVDTVELVELVDTTNTFGKIKNARRECTSSDNEMILFHDEQTDKDESESNIINGIDTETDNDNDNDNDTDADADADVNTDADVDADVDADIYSEGLLENMEDRIDKSASESIAENQTKVECGMNLNAATNANSNASSNSNPNPNPNPNPNAEDGCECTFESGNDLIMNLEEPIKLAFSIPQSPLSSTASTCTLETSDLPPLASAADICNELDGNEIMSISELDNLLSAENTYTDSGCTTTEEEEEGIEEKEKEKIGDGNEQTQAKIDVNSQDVMEMDSICNTSNAENSNVTFNLDNKEKCIVGVEFLTKAHQAAATLLTHAHTHTHTHTQINTTNDESAADLPRFSQSTNKNLPTNKPEIADSGNKRPECVNNVVHTLTAVKPSESSKGSSSDPGNTRKDDTAITAKLIRSNPKNTNFQSQDISILFKDYLKNYPLVHPLKPSTIYPYTVLTIIESVPVYLTVLNKPYSSKNHTNNHNQTYSLMRLVENDYINATTLLQLGGILNDHERNIVLSLQVGRFKWRKSGSLLNGTWIPLSRARALAATCSLTNKLGVFLNDNLDSYFVSPLPSFFVKSLILPYFLRNIPLPATTTSSIPTSVSSSSSSPPPPPSIIDSTALTPVSAPTTATPLSSLETNTFTADNRISSALFRHS